MSRLGLICLFCKNKEEEPRAVIQSTITGYIGAFIFNSWKDSVHYLLWCNKYNKNGLNDDIFNEWCDKYGYYEDEEFIGNYNEFRTDGLEFQWKLADNIYFRSNDDLEKACIWTIQEEDESKE